MSQIELLQAAADRYIRIEPLAKAIQCASNWRERLSAIKRYYAVVSADIYAAPAHVWAYDVYEVDWPMLFTPIEAALWSDIRQLGMPLYPQFPVEVYEGDSFASPRIFFPDFASPVAKVAIECDGKAFHADLQRDRDRDATMRRSGWTVYRFTGRECREDFNEETLQRSTVAKALERIARTHLDPESQRPKKPSRVFE